MAWRTIDGVAVDPLGPMKELETLVHGVFQRDLLLDYLRHFILFEGRGHVGERRWRATTSSTPCVPWCSVCWRPPGQCGCSASRQRAAWCGTPRVPAKSIEMTCLAAKLMQHPPWATRRWWW